MCFLSFQMNKKFKMLSLKVMVVLVYILISIKDTTLAHTITHDQVKEKIGVDEAGNGIAKLGEKEVLDGHNYVEVIGRGRKEMEEDMSYGNVNRGSLMAFSAADYFMPITHPPRNN